MLVLYFSDVHESERALEWLSTHAKEYDAIIVGGDLIRYNLHYMERFFNLISSLKKKTYYVPGNADPPDIKTPENVVPLHGRKESIDNLSIGGLGGSNITPFNTRFELTDEQASNILSSIGTVDILVSHCPPIGTECDRSISGRHLGSKVVRNYVETIRPQLVLSGHVHEARAIDKIGGTTIVNPGPMMYGNYAIITIGKKIDVRLANERF